MLTPYYADDIVNIGGTHIDIYTYIYTHKHRLINICAYTKKRAQI